MRRLAFVLLLGSAFAPALSADAQTRFAEAEARAIEVTESTFAESVSVVLTDCTGSTSAAAKRSCIAARRRAGRDALRGTYLVEFPAEGRIRFGSYERGSGGFRVHLSGFLFRRSSGAGVLSTAPTLAGRLPHAHVADVGFSHVAEGDAALWLGSHGLADYSVRVVVRLADDFEDAAAPSPNDRYGVRLEVLGMQVYGNTRGDVLVDTYASAVPPPLARLEERTRLWSHDESHEGVFVANDGTEVVLDASLVERDPGETTMNARLVQTVGATRTELLRMSAPCCTASIDVRRHGPTKFLAIVTEQAPTSNSAGRGRVVLFAWNRESGRFDALGEWVGSNGSPPPTWVLDPNVDP